MKPARSAILTYHSLDSSVSPISTAPQVFREQMKWLAGSGIPVVPLERIRDSPGAVALTFDDGFRNFLKEAFPVLRDLRLPSTVFVVSRYCGERNRWPSQPASPRVPDLALMSWSELREIVRDGVMLGSHTATHPYMTRLSAAEIEEELSISQREIEDRVGQPVRAFAYPYGATSPEAREAVRRRFPLACGTKLDFVSQASDAAELPRLDAYYLQDPFWFRSLGAGYGAAYIAARRFLRERRPL